MQKEVYSLDIFFQRTSVLLCGFSRKCSELSDHFNIEVLTTTTYPGKS